jgi:acetolactate decarboxylase
MKKTVFLICFVFCFSLTNISAQEADIVYQQSSINALMEGLFDGELQLGCLKNKGNFGIGTFDNLDGEMVLIDGQVYQIKSDGNSYKPKDEVETPFAMAVFFKADDKKIIDHQLTSYGLTNFLDSVLPSKNRFYALKISGKFKYAKVRSVHAQTKPYPRLADALSKQKVFELRNLEADIVGFWSPEFAEGLNIPGYHLHFITKDRTHGGHLLDCVLDYGDLEIDYLNDYFVELPKNKEFLEKDFSKSIEKELEEGYSAKKK